MIYIGIDPGLHGAIALLNAKGKVLGLYDMPMTEGTYDCKDIFGLMNGDPCVIGIEAVYRFPKISMGFGLLVGVSYMVNHSTVIKIPPRRWQKWWGIKKADKNLSRELAMKRWPQSATSLKRKMDHNRAEALLIAEYTRKNHTKY